MHISPLSFPSLSFSLSTSLFPQYPASSHDPLLPALGPSLSSSAFVMSYAFVHLLFSFVYLLFFFFVCVCLYVCTCLSLHSLATGTIRSHISMQSRKHASTQVISGQSPCLAFMFAMLCYVIYISHSLPCELGHRISSSYLYICFTCFTYI
ncbi:hypothetical protein V8C26DRAFT_403397 [Trichoderma gracile]